MKIGRYILTVDLGHLLLLAGFAAFVVWYNEDARNASIEIENTILIVPASILALLLCLFVACQTIHIRPVSAPVQQAGKNEDPPATGAGPVIVPACYMTALAGYVFFMEAVGFDVATAAFVAVAMRISGERRPHVIALFSISFAALCVYSLKLVLPLDLPTLLF
jgi:putative tricarboxylic transport membrane protein